MNLMVCGGRDFNDRNLLFSTLDELITKNNWTDIIILEGEAKGADDLAKKYTMEKKLLFKPYPADWKKWGKAAGPIRNKAMVEDCDYCVAFWDGQSRGTKSSIDFCKQIGKPCKVVYYGGKTPESILQNVVAPIINENIEHSKEVLGVNQTN